MTAYLSLPIAFLKFWYIDAPRGFFAFFASLNEALLQLFSLPLLVKTFFKPLKNEYREGLVNFSIGMGIFVKTCLILVDLLVFFVVFFLELVFILLFLAMPIATVLSLFF